MMYFFLLVIGYFFLTSDKKKKEHDSNYVIPNPNNDTNINNQNTATATISQEKAKALSERLFQIMGLDWWTSIDDIKSVLKDISTEANYKLVSYYFGERAYSNLGGGSTWDIFGEKLDLTQWILREMDSESDRKYLQKLFPNIF
ncbi:hypothetical protein FIA58_009140 [Flavobacterium jejuense]|uniref:Uncharacterized protein n=1 Tax=Flavobacterium jejuense TaxID=1544455 RepID=A0ABX0IPR8_9FLAO|nr:hypothetical protein [Flavobacterium jejuense]NHN25837.1 hypothetical protein [Flavobacterium jejuense]